MVLHGAETWALTQTHENKMDLTEVRMTGMTRSDKIYSEGPSK